MNECKDNYCNECAALKLNEKQIIKLKWLGVFLNLKKVEIIDDLRITGINNKQKNTFHYLVEENYYSLYDLSENLIIKVHDNILPNKKP